MLEKILDFERTLFLQLNGVHSLFGDQFMWLYSGLIYWIPLAVCFFVFLFVANRTRWREVLLIVAAIVLVVTLCDQFASGFCKPFFARFRPTYHPDFMNEVQTVFDYRGGRYGFISSHAANGFGFATLSSLIFKNKWYTVLLFLWATISAYSRIYLGVHFISDIIPGILTGLLFGWMVYLLFKFAHTRFFTGKNGYSSTKESLNPASGLITVDIPNTYQSTKKLMYPHEGLTVILFLLIISIALMAVISILSMYRIIPAINF